MQDCVFCKIVKGEIPSTKVFENDRVMVFLDIMPASKGHALVIPKEHFETLGEVPEELLKELIVVVQRIAKVTMEKSGAQGFNVIQSNNRVAGQVIPHLHFHIIPRKESDNLSFVWQQGKAEQKELEEYAKMIKENLNQ